MQAAAFVAVDGPDLNDVLPGDGICANPTGACTLRAAVDEANALAGRDSIELGPGIHDLFQGELIVSEDLDIVGGGQGTIIDANRKSRVILIEDPAVSLTMTSLELINGHTDEAGGIIHNAGILEVTDARLKGGKALRGSGVYNTGSMILRRVGLIRHTDQPPAGLGGAIANIGFAILDSVSVVRGQARLGCGGGIYNTGTIEATNLYVARNRARLGFAGGICNAGGTINCVNCLIARNQANQFTGGIRNDGVMRLWNSAVVDNFVHRGTIGRFNDPNCSGIAPVSGGHNVEDRDSCNFNQVTDLINAKVRLRGPSAIRGTFLVAGKPRGDSVLVDRANNAICPPEDLTGKPRPIDGDEDTVPVCDVGPLEFQP
ncbi:MAG TPA: hypothetical protein VEB21_12055 [Terriglobales bacterium]|nr:hypothetical protein [Terriglobales bacterium]